MSPFEQLLTEMIKQRGYLNTRYGEMATGRNDVAHLKRWLKDGRATEIWEAWSPGNFSDGPARSFITAVLLIRERAWMWDHINKDRTGLRQRLKARAAKERRHLAKLLTKGELSPEEYKARIASVEEKRRATGDLDSWHAVRSDENGTRRRTLFCRLLSNAFLHAKGRSKGRRYDAQVAALCEIALGCKDVTADMVRSAREAGRRDAKRSK
jgi:hypothetical protein